MTTLRDLLNDFANEIADMGEAYAHRGTIEGQTRQESIDERLDGYIDTIKERLIG